MIRNKHFPPNPNFLAKFSLGISKVLLTKLFEWVPKVKGLSKLLHLTTHKGITFFLNFGGC